MVSFVIGIVGFGVSETVNADNEDDFLKRKPMFSPTIAICSE